MEALDAIIGPEAAAAGIVCLFMEGAHVLSVPEGVVQESPLVIRIAATCALMIKIAARSNVSMQILIEGTGEATIDVHILLESEAVCDVLCVQRMEATATCTIQQTGEIGEGAHLTSRHVTLGAASSTTEADVHVNGHSGRSDIDWMIYAAEGERHAANAINRFEGTNGEGEITMRGVAQGNGTIQARGLIAIGLKGRGTNTYLTQNVLMLDEQAKVDAVPGLEIKTNDVKASHSATVARITAEDLFYFSSRGIPARDARKMYVLGFLGSLLGRIEDTQRRDDVLSSVEAKYDRA